MSEQLIWTTGNRNPSITENIVDTNGAAINLTGSTVKFKMRAVGSTTLKVDLAATVVDAPTGSVRYDWAAADVDTEGYFLVWWEVTTSGKTQDVMEAVIEFRSHAPETHAYLELELLKSTLELTNTTFAEADLQSSIVAGSRAVDQICNRRFWADTDASQIRYYSGNNDCRLWIDDLVTFTAAAVDTNGDGTFGTAWAQNSEFVLGPLNAVADGKPFTHMELTATGGGWFPNYPRSVRVTGKFGWAAVPEEVKTATSIIATQLVKRLREAPFGVVTFGIEGEAVRIARSDPHVSMLLKDYIREKP